MDFQHHLQNGWRLVKEHPLLLLLGGMLIQFLIILSLGIMAGPLAGGFLLMMIRFFREGRHPEFNDLFGGLRQVLQLFPFFFLGLLVLLGFMFFIIPGILFLTWWLYALPLMADRKLPLGEAMRASHRKVREKGFFMHFAFLIMITVIPSLLINVAGLIIPLLEILHLFLFPVQTAVLASLYLEQFSPENPACSCPGASDFSADRAPSGLSREADEKEFSRGLD
jgi:hypothetical protein